VVKFCNFSAMEVRSIKSPPLLSDKGNLIFDTTRTRKKSETCLTFLIFVLFSGFLPACTRLPGCLSKIPGDGVCRLPALDRNGMSRFPDLSCWCIRVRVPLILRLTRTETSRKREQQQQD
jgi:hypothetical protein